MSEVRIVGRSSWWLGAHRPTAGDDRSTPRRGWSDCGEARIREEWPCGSNRSPTSSIRGLAHAHGPHPLALPKVVVVPEDLTQEPSAPLDIAAKVMRVGPQVKDRSRARRVIHRALDASKTQPSKRRQARALRPKEPTRRQVGGWLRTSIYPLGGQGPREIDVGIQHPEPSASRLCVRAP